MAQSGEKKLAISKNGIPPKKGFLDFQKLIWLILYEKFKANAGKAQASPIYAKLANRVTKKSLGPLLV